MSVDRKMKASHHSQAGFTLVELMVALVLAGLILTMAVPSFDTMIRNNRLAVQANQLIASLNYARTEAIKRKVNIDIVATAPSASNEWGGGWTVKISGGDTLKVFSALEGANTLDSSNNLSTYRYLPSGRSANIDTVDLCDDRTAETGRRISITATGRVNIANITCV